MTETRETAVEKLFSKWEQNAQRMDDYRGIVMCLKDLKIAWEKPSVIPTPEIQELLKRATDHLTAMKGHAFFQAGDPTEVIIDLVNAVKVLSTPKPVCVHDFRAKLAGLSYHAICVKCTLDAGIVDVSGLTVLQGVKA